MFSLLCSINMDAVTNFLQRPEYYQDANFRKVTNRIANLLLNAAGHFDVSPCYT